MTNPEAEDDALHWQKLAEEFGLPPEPAPAVATPPATTAEAVPSPGAVPESLSRGGEEATRSAEPESVSETGSASEIVEESAPRTPHERVASRGRRRRGRGSPQGGEPAEERLEAERSAVPPRGEESEESPTPARRRRSRRSTRTGTETTSAEVSTATTPVAEELPTDASLASAPAEPEPITEEIDTEEEKPRRRSRGRKRRRSEPEAVSVEASEESSPEEEESEETAEETPTAVEEEDDDDDLEMSYANWNVPSWQELIASLYRPER